MPSEENGMAWHVAFAGSVAQELKTLHKQAKAIGLGGACVDAIKYGSIVCNMIPWPSAS